MLKTKRTKTIKLQLTGWHSTDADEINRRRLRGEAASVKIKNIEPHHRYFSSFLIYSTSGAHYHVEIRSLDEHINSCNCPDYQTNGLGTCKHIESVLFHLKKKSSRQFLLATQQKNPRIEIFSDRRRESVIYLMRPSQYSPSAKKLLEPFFSTDGQLLANPVAALPAMQRAVEQSTKSLRGKIRISKHLQDIIETRKRCLEKQSARKTFLMDVEENKHHLNVVKHPLYPYQQEGLLHLAFTERALLADEMGLGKTVQAIAACALLHKLKNIQRVLVVATASLKTEWEEQIKKFTDLPYLTLSGSRKDRLKQYQQPSFFYLSNYEQIVVDHAEIQRLIAPDIIILDEAQRIKNWQTKTATAVKKLSSRYAFVLTGTPIENRIDDIYSIVQFLDASLFGPLFRFNREFYQLDEKGKPTGYKNLDELHRRLRPIMLRRQKADVEGQLPQRTINNYFVAMAEEQRLRYEEYQGYVARLLVQAKRRSLYKEEFEKLQRFLSCMRMICDTPYILDEHCRICPKLNELEKLLEELLLDKKNKIIIFSEWERMLLLVKNLAKQQNWMIAWHTGSVSQKKRRAEINCFKENPQCQLFLSTDAGSLGLNLQTANIVINLDLPWNPAKLEQRIARAWRKYQTRTVNVINIICEDSIEHRMLGLLEHKQMLSKSVLEGNVDFKEMALPSGRAAFMERMESLLGTTEPSINQTSIITDAAPIVLEQFRDDALARLNDKLMLLEVRPNQSIFAVVASQENLLHEQLRQALTISHKHHTVPAIEIVDKKTFELIQRLEAMGMLSINKNSHVLYVAEEITAARQKIKLNDCHHAKEALLQADRKRRLVKLLIDGGFFAETQQPLQEMLKLVTHAFAYMQGISEQFLKEADSQDFIENSLVKEYGLNAKIIPVLNELNKNSIPSEHNAAQSLFDDSQIVLQQVNEILTKNLLG